MRKIVRALCWSKSTLTMPSPLGEGQTDTPIHRHNRGEVTALHPRPRFVWKLQLGTKLQSDLYQEDSIFKRDCTASVFKRRFGSRRLRAEIVW